LIRLNNWKLRKEDRQSRKISRIVRLSQNRFRAGRGMRENLWMKNKLKNSRSLNIIILVFSWMRVGLVGLYLKTKL